MRLNRYLASCGVCSRRKADELIANGSVQVNGAVTREYYIKIGKDDRVMVKGKEIAPNKHLYIALNKPIGYTCTLKDRFASMKVVDLLPRSFGRIYPVGRLDKNSSGLIILTNDGDFALRLEHPRYRVEKEYSVGVCPRFLLKDIPILKKGVVFEGEKLKASDIRVIENDVKSSLLRVILKEGKKREIRRMLSVIGYSSRSLKRIRIGAIYLSDLLPGKYRFLTEKEIAEVFAYSEQKKRGRVRQ